MISVGDALVKITGDTKGLETALNDANAKVASSAQQMQKSLMAVGIAFTAIGAAGLKMADSAREMNAQLGQVALTLGVTTKEMRDLALATTDVTFPLKSVAATFELLAQAGIRSTKEMQASANAFDALADATGSEAEVVAAQLIPAFKVFGLTLPQSSKDLDKFTWLAKNTTVGLDDFASAMNWVARYGSSLNLTIEDMIAIMAALEAKGITGSAATRLFRTAVTQAADGSVTLTDALGLTTGAVEEYRSKLEDAAGITDKYAKVAATQYGIIDKLKQKFSELTLSVGSFLTPLEPFMAAMTSLGPIMIFLSTSFGLAAAKMIFFNVVAIGVRAAILAIAAAQWLWNVAMSANPIGLLLLAIGGLAAGILLISRRWGESTADVRRELEEQTRLVQENADKQKQAIWDVYNQRVSVVNAETQKQIDALEAQNEAIRKGDRDAQLADQKEKAMAEAAAGDQTAMIQYIKDAAIVANEDKIAALKESGEAETLTLGEWRDNQIVAIDEIAKHWQLLIAYEQEYESHVGLTTTTPLQILPAPPSSLLNLNLPKLAGGGLITEPTLLWGMQAMRPYAMAGERGTEVISPIGAGAGITNIFNISELVVRENADVQRIARELHRLQQIKGRQLGYAT